MQVKRSGHTLRRADTHAEAIDKSAHHQHSNVLGSADNDGTNAPNDGADLDRPLTAEDIRQLKMVSGWADEVIEPTYKARGQGAHKRATGHGSSDTTLGTRVWSRALRRSVRALVEVTVQKSSAAVRSREL